MVTLIFPVEASGVEYGTCGLDSVGLPTAML
jgi:hypothetical protein